MLVLELYVIVWRLRLRLDVAGYVILLTYLACMAARILLTVLQEAKVIDSIILVVGYSITQGTLYYFIFEMKYTALKMQSENTEVYALRK
jgi:hypothetical protein